MKLPGTTLLLAAAVLAHAHPHCKFDSVGSELKPKKDQSCFERGEGICSGDWGFGLTGDGKLRLYDGNDQVWDSGEKRMDFCNMNKGGTFACYKGSCFNPTSKAIFSLNCGGKNGSYMKIDGGDYWVVQKKGDKYSWALEKDGDEVGTCVYGGDDFEGDDDQCFFDSVGTKLKPKSKGSESCIERGEGICSGKWGFGVTSNGKLRLYEGGDVVWDSDEKNIDFCSMNEGGSFACYKGSCFHPKGKAIFSLNCGGKAGSYMDIDKDRKQVVKKNKDKKSWAIENDGDEVGSC